jgi:hypothetical protein
MSSLTELIQNKSVELMPIMYPNLTPAQVAALWDNFGNANPVLRDNYLAYIELLKTQKPGVTDENALSIINSGVAWLIQTANSLPTDDPGR